MSDSSSQSDDTSGGGSRSSGGRGVGRSTNNTNHGQNATRRRRGVLNAKERNIRRLESNERERMRMHSLNDAFQVSKIPFLRFLLKFFILYAIKIF